MKRLGTVLGITVIICGDVVLEWVMAGTRVVMVLAPVGDNIIGGSGSI